MRIRKGPFARGVTNGVLLAVGASVASAPSAQSRWIQSVTAPTEFEYDSNPNMAAQPAAGTTWLRVTPSVTTRYVLDTDEFGLEAQLTAAKSSNTEVAQDRLDPRLRAFWKHADPLNTTELAAVLDRSALRDVDLTQQVPIGVDGSRTQFGLSGKWTRDLDARSTIVSEVGQEWERFSGTQTPDFSRTSAAVRYTRAMSERQSWYASANAQAYRAESASALPGGPVAGTRSTVVGALAGLKHEFTPSFHVDGSVGPLQFTSPDARSSWQGGVKAEYTAERGLASLELSRTPVVNSSAGGLVAADQLQLRLRYDLGPLQRLELEASHARERATRSTGSLATLAWMREWSPSWQFGVKASTQRQVGPAGTATSNRIGVVLVYTAPDL